LGVDFNPEASYTGDMKNLVRLLPNNMRLKQLIKEHGDIWHIEHGPEPMQCFGNNDGFGIRSTDGKHFRNVRPSDIEQNT